MFDFTKKTKLSLIGAMLLSIFSQDTFALFGIGEDKDKEKQKTSKSREQKILEKDLSTLIQSERNSIDIFSTNVKSVVNVSNIRFAKRGFFDLNPMAIPSGAGSGFVWDKDGHIVTNFHVVANGDQFLISFHEDKKQYKAKLVGVEPRKDIAVLKLEEFPKNLKPILIGKSANLLVGQKALAIGNPFGLDHSLSTGSISALGRKIEGIGDVTINGMIQTDASINPGNSGGPLLDSSGKVIGMNTMIFSKSGTSSGVGFAVPVDTINRIVPQLIEHGEVIRPGLGIGILDDYRAARWGVDKGLVVTYLDEDGAAAKAGIKGMSRDRYGRHYIGDIILAIGKTEVNNFNDIYHALEKYKIGDKVKVKILRDDKEKTVDVTLKNFNSSLKKLGR